MEAPPLSAAAPLPPSHLHYPDSVCSSPRSRHNDPLDDSSLPQSLSAAAAAAGGCAKLRLMCSYGGHIVPRPHDKSLCYVGGETRIVVANRHATLFDLSHRLSKTLLNGQSFTLKYQLPSEDLDSLISVTTDEDLENMIEEFDRLSASASAAASVAEPKSFRLRLFLFPERPDSASSIDYLLENSAKSGDWFLNAINGANRGFSDVVSVNCLLGLDDDDPVSNSKDAQTQQVELFGNAKGANSVPESQMLETSSSFGSTSSSPPIRVDDPRVVAGGIEEQFSQMSVGGVLQKQDDRAFPPCAVPVSTALSVGVSGEYSNRGISDDERSEQRMATLYRKSPQSQPQLKQTGGLDSASPDSVSSAGSITNPLSRQSPMVYQLNSQQQQHFDSQHQQQLNSQHQEQLNSQQQQQLNSQHQEQLNSQHQEQLNSQQQQRQSNSQQQQQQSNSQQQQRLNSQQQQQLNQQQQQLNSQQHQQQQLNDQYQQLNSQQQHQLNQQLQQLNTQQQQQFSPTNPQYINHQSSGMQSYYPMYPPQQQNPQLQSNPALDQQYPVYYLPPRQPQAYNRSIQQSNYSDAAASAPSNRTQTPPSPSMIPNSTTYNPARTAVGAAKSEMVAGLYRTAASSGQQFMQVPSSQQHQQQAQYMGFSQIHNPSQSFAPTSGASANYAYEFADPTPSQVYYSRAMAPQMAAQHQTMASDAQLSPDNIKQQMRTTQP